MNDRLQQFLSAENLTQAQFADSINVAKASISHILAGRNKPGYEFIVNMMKAYPDLNIEWMLTGKGKMYRSANQGSVARAQDSPSGNDEDAPIELGLFSDSIPPISSSQEQDKSGQEDTQLQNIEISPETDTSGNIRQQTIRQRKAVKIIIFYDDGTFQEF